ncbi:MAG TPA: S9 family peptidase [Caulobacteraceae bacterium]|jgi:dipeptidyl aminopeptidase/acylaminoacyl peptidase
MKPFALAVAVSLLLAGAATAQAPLSVYGELPSIEQVAISPNGRELAFDIVKGEQRSIVVEDLAAQKALVKVQVGDIKVRRLTWAGNDHVIITSSSTNNLFMIMMDREEWSQAVDLNIPLKQLKPILGDIQYSGSIMSGYPIVRTINGAPALFAVGVYLADRGGLALFRIDLDTDRSSLVVQDPQANDYLLDAAGKPLAMTSYDAMSKDWRMRLWNGSGWKDAEVRSAAIETPEVEGLGRDGRSVLVGDYENDGWTLREMPAAGGAFSDPLPGPNVGSLIYDPATLRLIGVASLEGDTRRYLFYDARDQGRWDAIAGAFKGDDVELASWSDDRRKMIVRADSPTDGPAYALVDMDSGQIAWLGGEYPDLTPADIATVKPVRFAAADGLPLSGYLTLPQGRDPKNLPLVVFPHGGPAARDEPGFDWWAQAMASRGYAVLQVNYRGSAGFDHGFEAKGYGEWGQKMQTDLSDGVRYLASQGTIDPKRVCIVGASYGGYAALAGATLDTGVYRCAVDVSGPSELGKFVAWSTSDEGARAAVGTQRYWDRYMGAKGVSDPHLVAISPADHADKASIPILIIHGKDDTVVPFAQSQLMADALTAAHKPVTIVVLDREDHWLSHSQTRLQMLQATIDFLQKNNPPG